MTIYTIDNENSFTAFGSAKEAKSKLDAERFSSTKELARLAEKWPAPRLVEIWNTLALRLFRPRFCRSAEALQLVTTFSGTRRQ